MRQCAIPTPSHSGFHAVGIIFFILGLGTLLPWNFFITAIPVPTLTPSHLVSPPQYFKARLIVGTSLTVGLGGNSSGTQRDPARDEFNFNNWLTLLSQLPLLLFTLLNSFLYQCIPDKVRVLGSMSGILLLFILTAVLVRVEMPPHSFFSVTISSVWFINSFCAILQGSLFGQLGTLPQGYSTLFLSGQGMAGTFAASAMLLSMASGADAQTSALSYFITPCVGTLMSIVCYLVLPRMVRCCTVKASYPVPQFFPSPIGEFFTPVCCFLLFNMMDWLGRSVTSYCLWPEKRLWLLPLLVGLRFLFVPLLMLCQAEPRTRLPVLFHHDAWFILFMLPFSLSNGYFVSLTMCLAPKQVLPQESELAGAIMTFFLALGLSCGAGLSFLLKALL
uniref:Solute carrier family 29 member 2 n=1 Tax=Terrapene triunguis TaxID=2587831 RepID=A0A674K2I4_9SAUR